MIHYINLIFSIRLIFFKWSLFILLFLVLTRWSILILVENKVISIFFQIVSILIDLIKVMMQIHFIRLVMFSIGRLIINQIVYKSLEQSCQILSLCKVHFLWLIILHINDRLSIFQCFILFVAF